ncbi:MAG: Cell division protein FtsW [uncultured Thiotrichaceae bacterium]|uniref:Probable peptidoglycan glycosyltransferase FtsW n=1 Tax=uncultured Thiotrichaceae bacterium TaxID=298394 RepID=A0A6S6TN50_9GAMM|nr:MAG: Cell division protein FtsW [uncultured Thiotrichaceae bacterium]
MKTRLEEWLESFDKELVTVVFLLMGLGFVVMTSASVAIGEKLYDNPSHFMQRQLMYMTLGLLLGLIIYQIRLQVWRSLGLALLPVILFLLVAVLIPGIGKEVNGSRRWIDLGFASLQVSEVSKLIILMYLAGYMDRHGDKLVNSDSYKPLMMPLIVLGVFGTLLLLEPDFGTVVVVFSTGLAMLFLGGVKLSRLALLLAGTIAVMLPFLLLVGFRQDRIISFLNPWADASGTGYQVTNALMAIGDGGWFGSGLGGSVQKQFFLPEAHNDFIFAILADEFGFIGIVITLALFGWLVKRAFAIGMMADQRKLYYAAYLAYAIGFWIGFQALFHIGVNLAVLPPKGLTLPFISYGGSSLLVTLMAIAILLRIHRETQSVPLGTHKKQLAKKRKPKKQATTRPRRAQHAG